MAFSSVAEGPTHKQAVKLLSLEYDPPTTNLIWDAWAPHIAPPEGHPLTGGDLAKDFVLATLCKPFPTEKLTEAPAKTIVDAIANAITTQAFIAHTIQDLEEEEEANIKVIHCSHSPYPDSPEIRCLTTNPIPQLAPSLGLVS
jgi:hypothetical protein